MLLYVPFIKCLFVFHCYAMVLFNSEVMPWFLILVELSVVQLLLLVMPRVAPDFSVIVIVKFHRNSYILSHNFFLFLFFSPPFEFGVIYLRRGAFVCLFSRFCICVMIYY